MKRALSPSPLVLRSQRKDETGDAPRRFPSFLPRAIITIARQANRPLSLPLFSAISIWTIEQRFVADVILVIGDDSVHLPGR
jgi:hypothetical protein